ncbi:MAG: hypothetical protein ABSB56_06415 [Nitrososphaerales archaeon]|jgi:hypothetical protein
MGKKGVLVSVAFALVIGLGIGSVFFPMGNQTNGQSHLYEVEFTQQGVCSPKVWAAPWAVVMDKQTIVQPSNATLPLSESSFQASPSFENYSAIWFSVPNGTYSYAILPQVALPQHSGSVTVDGKDTTVEVQGAAISCTTTLSSSG